MSHPWFASLVPFSPALQLTMSHGCWSTNQLLIITNALRLFIDNLTVGVEWEHHGVFYKAEIQP